MEYVVRVSGSQKITPKVININGSEDSFYRYKMRQLYVQVVGKGKMIKTTLLNVDDVAKDLKVPPSFLTAYIGYEIGAPSKFDPKKPERERGSVSGEYDSSYLSDIVKKMIDEFVLCPKCSLPECVVSVDNKAKTITMDCRGCGASSTPTLGDKFQKFILNNEAKLQEVRNATPANGKAPAAVVKSSKPKAKKEKAEGPFFDASGLPIPDSDSEDEWAASTDAEAIRERQMRLLPEKFKGMVLDVTPTSEKTKEPSVASPRDLEKHCSEFLSKHSPEEFLEELKKLQKEHKLDTCATINLFLKSALAKDKELGAQIAEKKKQLKSLLCDEPSQLAFMEALVRFCETESATSIIPAILKNFYDDEVLDEESILKWHSSPSDAPLAAVARKKVDPLVEWFKTAAEESDEDDD